jgi:S-ribosylhomocysteine lyase LuxS involved in autoinducer biosynthesis
MFTKLLVATVLVSAGFAAGRVSPPASSTVYELRIYTPNEGKLDAVNARFRDHTRAIFDRHHMKSVGYWLPTEGPNAGKFIYILEHPSREEATKNWDAFNADPEWVKVKADSEANGKLVANVERTFMTPTDYSPIK